MDITRRGFFFGAAAVAASTALGGDEVDGNLTVFLSDIHISGKDVKGQPTYQNPLLDKAIDQILALRPRPRRAVVFGDVALWRGHAADYAESAPRLKRLSDAGIEVTVTTGNHDHRVPMFAAYPEQAKKTPVPGRVTSVVDLGTSDLFLLDSLNENAAGEGSNNAVAGTLDEAQAAWLKGAAAAAKRPCFVGAHHPPEELSLGRKNILAVLETNPFFAGYIHGHNHRWYLRWYHNGYSRRHVVRIACLPSTGWWGTIGFSLFRTFPDRAELSLAPGNDFFFPNPLKPGEQRPPEWDDIVAEERGGKCVFRYQA